MKRKSKKLKYYSESFKKARVQEYDKGQFTAIELVRMFEFSKSSFYSWVEKYSKLAKHNILIVEQKDSASNKLAEYQKRIKELERIVGNKQIKLDYLEKLIEIAEENLGVEIKKNSNTPHLDTFQKTEKK